MFKYKPGEGVIARGTCFWSLMGFAYLAGRHLFLWSQRFDFARKNLIAGNLPILGFPLTGAFLMGLAMFVVVAYGVWRLVNFPKVADLLVETELEMKKVTWPSLEEGRNAAFVVIICVVVMVAFLTLADKGLEAVFFNLIYGGAHG